MHHTSRILCLMVLAIGGELNAEEGEPVEEGSQRCINARSIRGADVIDDNHVVFHIQGRRMYLNALPKTCAGLSRDRRFSHETHTRSLCAQDKIRILRESGGGIYAGRSCSLGRFLPVTVEELENFVNERAVPDEPVRPKTADVEDVVTE